MIDLKSLIKKSVHHQRTDNKIKEAMILSLFNQAVQIFFQNDVIDKIKPLYFKEGNLTVASLSPAIVSDIKGKEENILDYINGNLSNDLVKKINYLT